MKTIRHELRVLADELHGIRVALEAAIAVPAAVEVPGCRHPREARIDFGRTGGVEDWQCGACGYRVSLTEG